MFPSHVEQSTMVYFSHALQNQEIVSELEPVMVKAMAVVKRMKHSEKVSMKDAVFSHSYQL